MDQSYSPDVELDENGRLVLVRDVGEGEVIRLPGHLFMKAARDLGRPSIQTSIPAVEWASLFRGK